MLLPVLTSIFIRIMVYTGTKFGAGTDSNISLALFGACGSSVRTFINPFCLSGRLFINPVHVFAFFSNLEINCRVT
jgi:hypothetical protein